MLLAFALINPQLNAYIFYIESYYYSDTDVNVQFKTPLRHEYKQNVSEEELAIRQAEHMQKLYQEERRRKYLQECSVCAVKDENRQHFQNAAICGVTTKNQ